MSVQIHTEDPISPVKARGSTPQTADSSNAENPSQLGEITTPSPNAYPRAQPGAVAPTPTSTVPQSPSAGPPAPQPGAAPVPPPPIITARPRVPPPPKAGEKPLSPEHYTPVHSTPAQPQPYPPQASQPPIDDAPRALPPGSTTSTSTGPSYDPLAPPPPSSSRTPTSPADMPGRAAATSLEHPPGYQQNPFASEMRADQRFAAQQEQENGSDGVTSLGYTDNSRRGAARPPGLEDDQTVWGTAKKWAKETGGQASRFGEDVWNKFSAGE